MRKRLNLRQTIGAWIWIFACIGCNQQALPTFSERRNSSHIELEIFSEENIIDTLLIVEKEAIIYPGTVLRTTGKGKVIFMKTVSIIGQSQVFDVGVNVEFRFGSLSLLNPTWFGAKGYDDIDDTKAIQKVFDIAFRTPNALEIQFPTGRFLLSEQVIIQSTKDQNIPLYIRGVSSSSDGFSGSSIIWIGEKDKSMFLIRNLSQAVFENLDLGALSTNYLRHNLEFRPVVNQIVLRGCRFSGCASTNSSNINLNEGNNLQVSELIFDNCLFRGIKTKLDYTENAVRGGWANTKNFYFYNCSFGPYQNEAIKVTTSDVLTIEDCTFFENDIDISCETCKTRAVSNYSEGSHAFFYGTTSANFNATTLINNQFTGLPKDGFVIRGGSGTLALINNNFGAGNFEPDLNRVRWSESEFSLIYSFGNVFKNASDTSVVFYNQDYKPFRSKNIVSSGDLGGTLGEGRKRLRDMYRQ